MLIASQLLQFCILAAYGAPALIRGRPYCVDLFNLKGVAQRICNTYTLCHYSISLYDLFYVRSLYLRCGNDHHYFVSRPKVDKIGHQAFKTPLKIFSLSSLRYGTGMATFKSALQCFTSIWQLASSISLTSPP